MHSISTRRDKDLFRVGRGVTRGNGRKQSKAMSRLTIKKNISTLKPEGPVKYLPKQAVGTFINESFQTLKDKARVWRMVLCWQGMKGLSHSSSLTPCPHPPERNSLKNTMRLVVSWHRQKEKLWLLRLGAWEVFFKLASITRQMITSFRVIFLFFFFQPRMSVLEGAFLWINETSRLHCQLDWNGVFSGESLRWQTFSCYKSIKSRWFQQTERATNLQLRRIWPVPCRNRKIAFIFPRAGLFKI